LAFFQSKLLIILYPSKGCLFLLFVAISMTIPAPGGSVAKATANEVANGGENALWTSNAISLSASSLVLSADNYHHQRK
jgi:hypothetical protein